MYDERTIIEKLVRRFGWGTDKERRLKLYQRVAAAITEHGEPAYRVVSQVAAEAVGKTHPDRYFCYASIRRLEENGHITGGDL